MLFNSIQFAIFLPIIFALYYIIPHKFRWIMLLIASYYFYMSWNPELIILILGTTLISYLCGFFIPLLKTKKKKKLLMLFGVITSLAILFLFKYFNFFSTSVVEILRAFSLPVGDLTLKLLLPVGISFYTFQTLSYVIDVYKERIEPEKHFGYYALFVSFFPQLVAGPIERPENLLPQLKTEQKFDYGQAAYGLKLMAWGFIKKIVIADTLAIYVDQIYSNVANYKGFEFILATLFFAIQIFCDFSGYSDIAIGAAYLFGIKLMTNFKSPYFSLSIKEFWSRWHISLSSWLRDYVYIPLGGSRVKLPRYLLNLLITFLLSGLWHGADWTFVIWGALHGVAMVVDALLTKLSKKRLQRHKPKKNFGHYIGNFVKWAITFLFVCFAWIFFRANNLGDAVYIIKNMFTGLMPTYGNLRFVYDLMFASVGFFKVALMAVSCAALPVFDFINLNKDPIKLLSRRKLLVRWACYFAAVFIIYMFSANTGASFIYFQF